MIGVYDDERETFAVHGPYHVIYLSAFGQIKRCCDSVFDPDQAGRGATVPAMAAVDGGIDPHAGQLMHRCSQLGERGIKHGIGEKHVIAGWRNPHPRELWCMEHLQQLFRWRLPPGCRLLAVIGCPGVCCPH